MQTLTSTRASLVRTDSPTGARVHRPGWPVIALIAAAAVMLIAVVTISVLWATSDSSSTPTRVVQSTNAAEQSVAPAAAPVVRSANAAEAPRTITPGVVQSTNAAEAGVPVPTAVGHTSHAPQLEPQFQVHAPMARFQ